VVKAALEANVPNCNVVGEATPTTSGAFEVKNIDNGKVYWSKLGGQGHLETKDDVGKVIEAIKADA
jgi:selT/selW/selH-like putative selenoprotein